MRSPLVVIDHLPVGGLLHFGKIVEKVQVEHFLSIGAVEPLDIGIPVRFVGLNVEKIE